MIVVAEKRELVCLMTILLLLRKEKHFWVGKKLKYYLETGLQPLQNKTLNIIQNLGTNFKICKSLISVLEIQNIKTSYFHTQNVIYPIQSTSFTEECILSGDITYHHLQMENKLLNHSTLSRFSTAGSFIHVC